MPKASLNLELNDKSQSTTIGELNELRVFSINLILKEIKEILFKHKIYKVILFLDDFSELSKDNEYGIVFRK